MTWSWMHLHMGKMGVEIAAQFCGLDPHEGWINNHERMEAYRITDEHGVSMSEAMLHVQHRKKTKASEVAADTEATSSSVAQEPKKRRMGTKGPPPKGSTGAAPSAPSSASQAPSAAMEEDTQA